MSKKKKGAKYMKVWQGKMRYVIIAFIVLCITFFVGAFVITSLDTVIQQHNVNYVDVLVANKYINNDSEHFYIVVSENGDIFDIVNITDSEGIYKQIKVGKEYRFITEEPFSANDKYIHILQVYNGTS
jgi:hypothetical protein